ncbi:hypothetical protein TIFTF001_038693 [Ficus carica]|uniref:Uncharacterized protein n=1 Tax=Ficus carica TaxID=3494 RepID=A0AA88E7S0_FICCA|nr:hypothetical protein TIFTF001_038693 [Ficus carica]
MGQVIIPGTVRALQTLALSGGCALLVRCLQLYLVGHGDDAASEERCGIPLRKIFRKYFNNKLTGEKPSEITELVGLISLNLSRNNLSGEIPKEIGQLKSLDVLDLSKNHLSGRIPSSLSQVSGLNTLDLSDNSLSGKIPTGTQLQTRDAAAYFANPKLCGEPLPKKCPGEDEPATSGATEDHGDDQDDEYQLITKGFYISSAVGFIVVFWGFCLTLIFNKSWRYRYLKSLNKA